MLIHPDCGGEELCGCLGSSRSHVADEGCGVGLDGPVLTNLGVSQSRSFLHQVPASG